MTAKENMEKIFQHEKPDWIPHLGAEAYGIRDYIVERPIMTTGRDAWGCNWISCPDSLNITHPDTSDIKLEEVTEWREKVTFPDLDQIDFSPMEEEAKAFTDRDSKMLQYVSLNGIFERTHILMGFENALCQVLLEPEEYGEFLSAIADHKIKLFQKVYEICQPDILVYHDDMAIQTGPYFGLDFYREHLFPQYKRIVDAAREIGYPHVVHHSCGKVDALLPDWISCGFDGWDSVMACNDLTEIKKNYGEKIVFMPGLDTQQVLGPKDSTRGDIEKMVVDWMEMLAGDGTGLIIDSTVAYSLNPENEKICLEFIEKHGRAFIDAKKKGIAYQPQFE